MTYGHSVEAASLDFFSTVVPLRFNDFDLNGHLGHVKALELAEIARVQHLQAMGIGPQHLVTVDRAVVVLELTVRYLREIRAATELEGTSSFVATSSKTMRHQQSLRHEGVEVCKLDVVAGLLDLSSRRLCAGPVDEMRRLIERSAQAETDLHEGATR